MIKFMEPRHKIINATADHSAGILNIYKKFITDSSATFETKIPSVEEFAERIRSTTKKFPWLLYFIDDQIAGYAYASAHRSRAAYQWSCEVSVYLNPRFHRQGIASKLYETLLKQCRSQGYFNAYAGITLPNAASERFHLKAGFKLVGTYEKVGFKHGTWHDVSWFQLALQPHENLPMPPNSPH